MREPCRSDAHPPHPAAGLEALGSDEESIRYECAEYLNHDKAARNFRHFMNILNRHVYGHAAERYGKRLRCIPIPEGGTPYVRLHYHAIIDCPDRVQRAR